MQLMPRKQSSLLQGHALIRNKTYGLNEPGENRQCYGEILSKGHKKVQKLRSNFVILYSNIAFLCI